MENASKALIIAGGVLIAMLVLSVGVLLVNRLSQTSESYVEKLDFDEIRKYNSYFEVYEGRENISVHDIITAIGIAKQKDMGTRVYIGNDDVTDESEEWKNELLENSINTLRKNTTEKLYTCTIEEYDENSGRVKKIKFNVKN